VTRGAPTIPQVVQLHHLLRGGYTPLARGAPPKREKKWKEERRKRAGKKEKRKEEHRKSGVPLRIGG